jgi:hypothetical protein
LAIGQTLEKQPKSFFICADDLSCNCELPFLVTSESFTIAPSSTQKTIATCELNLLDINKVIGCVLPETSISKQLCKIKDKIDCENLNINSTPITYSPSIASKKNCGYKWKGFSLRKYRVQVKKWKESGVLTCNESMCTSATFLALISHAKFKMENGEMSQEEYDAISTVGGDAYKMLNTAAEPNELVERFGLGEGHVIHIADAALDESPVPTKGDIVQLWRNTGSGHSVVFKGLLDSNNDGVSDKFCYWRSQKRTDGFGNSCEDISKINRLLVGHLK